MEEVDDTNDINADSNVKEEDLSCASSNAPSKGPVVEVGEDLLSKPEYAYLKQQISTEVNKIEIHGLPKYVGYKQLKKLIASDNINPHKIKVITTCGSTKRVGFCNF